MHTPPTARTGLHTCACHLDCTMHARGVSWHKLALNKKSHRCRASTFLMGGEYIQHWSSPPTYQAPKKHQSVMLKPPAHRTASTEPPRSPEEEARDILATAAKNQAEDGPSTRRAAIRACKYLRAMVNQHGPLIQSAHEAAKIHTQRSTGNAAAAMQYRPKEGELPVIAPELTSELLHCLSTLPDPWPLAKITIDMEKPSQWVSKMCRLFLLMNTSDARWECPQLHRYQIWSRHSRLSRTFFFFLLWFGRSRSKARSLHEKKL